MPQKKNKTTTKETMPQETATAHPVKRKKAAVSAVPEQPVTQQADAALKTEKKIKTAKEPAKKTARKKAAAPKTTDASAPVKEKAPRKPRAKKAESAVKETPSVTVPAAPAVQAKPVEIEIKQPVKKHIEPTAPAAAPIKKETHKEIPQTPQPQPAAEPAPAAPAPAAVKREVKGEIKISELTTVRELSEKLGQRPGDLIKKLLSMGSLVTINQKIDTDTATLLAHEFGYDVKVASIYVEEAVIEEKDDPAKLKPRSPVVTIMGHVDHGKTSLLDAIRESRVADGEAGGITQHIGAYKVKTPKGEIAFLDTPGHEAFTAMRSRGAKATDIVVLVVSAADGVMPQTVEAIDHARAAGVPIIVAINKVDLPTANPAQVKQELSKYNLMPEDWGGDTIMVEVSAKKHTNIDGLLEMVLLKAEMMELKANPDRLAKGVIVEARLDPRRGPVATVLVQNGTLHVSDNFIAGPSYGKVRAMSDEHGTRVNDATPGTPVEILGFTTPPQAGDQFIAMQEERQARETALARQNRAREESLKPRHHLTLEDISSGKVKELRIIIKTDVQGSLGAVRDSLERLSTAEINLNIIHAGVGAITESDVTLAAASDALIIGFNIRPDTAIDKLAEHEGVSIRVYRIIYELISEVRAAMEGLLEPTFKEIPLGKAAVRQVFKVTKSGMIAGCMITEGKILRGSKARLVRDNVIVYEGTVSSLRRFKEDVKEVEKGFECGISLENYGDMKAGDLLEVFTKEKVIRKLEE